MRKINYEFDSVKEFVKSLEGKEIKMLVNKGRKKFVRYSGVLECIYPSVFMVRITGCLSSDIMTYSYSDVLCGDVRLSAN